MTGPVQRPVSAPARPSTRPRHAAVDPGWRQARLAEARAVLADAAHHSDHLLRMACEVVIRHGPTENEREEARVLLLVLDARRPVPQAQRAAQRRDDPAGERP
tara:strand:- start:671 stop:979 length:309 start_codon:yes stop_codon:yes gene_type:complete